MSNTNYPSRRFHPLTPADFFRGMLGSKMADDFFEKGWLAETSSMRADLKETDTAFILEAELPGFKKEDISVEYQDGRLLISAKKDEETKEEKENYIKRERYYGEVSRRFRVAGIEEQKISAEYKEGVLKVNLPKSEPAAETKKKIDIG
ncbi:MAG: Hsp20/alpha crystallin family protein [Firmicutes bacterium]|nr:Hsp20/alpha crystallin family protein [Bacillota bacterium]